MYTVSIMTGEIQTGTATLDVHCKYYDRGTVKQNATLDVTVRQGNS